MKIFFNTMVLGLLFVAVPQEKSVVAPRAQLQTQQKTPVYTYRVVKEYPHDRNAFTQGLVVKDGKLYEGTGQFGESALRLVDIETGNVIKEHRLQDHFFGEGITVWQNQIIQLTWLSRTGFVYDLESFDEVRQFSYPWEGWGITHDGSQLIMSDGTDTLHFLDPVTFEQIHEIEVHDRGNAIRLLNELEYINGEIYANVWMTDLIARIDPVTGSVTSWIDLSGLLQPDGGLPRPDVLNGIAYDNESQRLFVTGKRWHRLFQIELIPQNGSQVKDWAAQ